jgi:hypothetical protein
MSTFYQIKTGLSYILVFLDNWISELGSTSEGKGLCLQKSILPMIFCDMSSTQRSRRQLIAKIN